MRPYTFLDVDNCGNVDRRCGHMGLDKTRGDFVAALTALLGEYATKLDQEAVLAADKATTVPA